MPTCFAVCVSAGDFLSCWMAKTPVKETSYDVRSSSRLNIWSPTGLGREVTALTFAFVNNKTAGPSEINSCLTTQEAAPDEFTATATAVGALSVMEGCQAKHVPLGDGSSGVGQHVGPVAELRPRAVEAHKHLADSIVLANLVIVQNGYNNLHFLWKRGEQAGSRKRVFGLEDDHGQLAGGGNVSQREADIAQLLLLLDTQKHRRALSRSRHSSVTWLKSTLFMGTLMSPMASCLEKRSKSYTVIISVFPPSSTQQVDLHVRVGRAAHVHSRQLRGLDDPHHELKEGSPRGQRKPCLRILLILQGLKETPTKSQCRRFVAGASTQPAGGPTPVKAATCFMVR
ncbi:hypothetical protein EYF80_028484 [Liparis tanakae]|uniref:Uncharacterized protein n=1 Tax=Liparis tanakae TaxID=230148 RepID=A0A4Z2H6N9_9TELE|nr:hypothetical protein EYF80_028484 [Liparis tanakae]